jgi:3-hydroxyanthranilate 3,4-dioxygenase
MKLPFNLFKWIEENRELLQPPVGNKQLFKADNFIVMLVGGPNQRSDFHYNESEEFFFQLQGDIEVDIQKDGRRETIEIKEGEIFLLPAKTPHSPKRPENTVGLVIELVRENSSKDGLQWYCNECNGLLFEKYFHLTSIEEDFTPVFQEYNDKQALRTCTNCGFIAK